MLHGFAFSFAAGYRWDRNHRKKSDLMMQGVRGPRSFLRRKTDAGGPGKLHGAKLGLKPLSRVRALVKLVHLRGRGQNQ